MHRDVAQWSSIRDRILSKGVSIRQVSRETGISYKTIRKMLDQTLPRPYGPRNHRYPKLGPYIAPVQRMFRENTTLPPAARWSIKAIYEHIRDAEGFSGSYGSVSDYVRSTAAADKVCILERYVRERNEKFRRTPKRAGGKIWGMEREPARFSSSNNCKDPRYYR